MPNGTKKILWSVSRGICCIQYGVGGLPKGGFHEGDNKVEYGSSGDSISKGIEAGNAGYAQYHCLLHRSQQATKHSQSSEHFFHLATL